MLPYDLANESVLVPFLVMGVLLLAFLTWTAIARRTLEFYREVLRTRTAPGDGEG